LHQEHLKSVPIGYLVTNVGAAAALIADARHPNVVQAIVSEGGQPNLAIDILPNVTAPTLLIVGGKDQDELDLNKLAASSLKCHKAVINILGATHAFCEPGAFEAVARDAVDWFRRHLVRFSRNSEIGKS
jgi:pimeloyl-ACP methyl ester carboxylesterase